MRLNWLNQTLEEMAHSNMISFFWVCFHITVHPSQGLPSIRKTLLQENIHFMLLTHFVALETERNSSPACCPLLPVFPTPQIWREIIGLSNRSFQIMSHGLVSLCYREPGSLWNTLLILAFSTPNAAIKK
jgi:hypothetical protein